MAKNKEDSKKNPLSVCIIFDGKTIKLEGDSLSECVSRIPEGLVKAKALLRIEYKDFKREVAVYPFQVRRLIGNQTSRALFERQFLPFLK